MKNILIISVQWEKTIMAIKNKLKLQNMKALSIIAIFFSLIALLYSVTILKGDQINRSVEFSVPILVAALYFLAFSIVSIVTAFKKKK